MPLNQACHAAAAHGCMPCHTFHLVVCWGSKLTWLPDALRPPWHASPPRHQSKPAGVPCDAATGVGTPAWRTITDSFI